MTTALAQKSWPNLYVLLYGLSNHWGEEHSDRKVVLAGPTSLEDPSSFICDHVIWYTPIIFIVTNFCCEAS
jgi:hypothetical protein